MSSALESPSIRKRKRRAKEARIQKTKHKETKGGIQIKQSLATPPPDSEAQSRVSAHRAEELAIAATSYIHEQMRSQMSQLYAARSNFVLASRSSFFSLALANIKIFVAKH